MNSQQSHFGPSNGADNSSSIRQPVLEVVDLTTCFSSDRGDLIAVDSVSLTVHCGEVMGLVGESGSGKSVLAMSIARLVPSPGSIESGRVMFRGVDLLRLRSEDLRRVLGRDIGFIFQDPMSSLNPVLTIGEQIIESMTAHLNITARAARSRAAELLERVGVGQARRRMEDYPHQFSGGMRQRAMIAIAMACEPALVLADEPTTALDATVQAQILELIREMAVERQTAVVFITHDLRAAATLCDRISVMYAGRIVETGATDVVLGSPQMPYTRGLLDCLPSIEGVRLPRLLAIPGAPPDLARVSAGCRFAPRCPHARGVCRDREPALLLRSRLDRAARCWGTEPGGWLNDGT